MKYLLPPLLATASLLGQVPQDPAKIPREPSAGSAAKVTDPFANPASLGAIDHTSNQPASPADRAAFQPTPKSGDPAPLPTLAKKFVPPTDVLLDQPAADGPFWALGKNYKASFEADRWTFFAQPAAEADAAQPLTFRLARASVGEVAVDVSTHAQPVRQGSAITLRHGSIDETLLVAYESVEQTFTFTHLPTRGEIVLGIETLTALPARANGDALQFVNDWHHVSYSAAVAIDAVGNRIALPSIWCNGQIELRVPAAFVATAQLPLVIDPILASNTVVTGSGDVGNPDIVWAPATGWHVCWQRIFAAGDWDIYVQRLDANLNPIGTAVAIDYTSANWYRPKIAHLRAYGVSMVVAEVGTSPTKIAGRILDNAGTMTTGQFDVHATGSGSLVPDVGGDSGGAPTYFTVVWEYAYSAADHDIYARQVASNGTLRGTGPTYVQTSTANQSNPSISKSDGGLPYGTQRYTMVWQHRTAAGNEDIDGAMLTWDGVFVPVNGQNVFPINHSGTSHTYPQVSSPALPGSDGHRKIVVCYEAPSVNNGDIELSAMREDGLVLWHDNLLFRDGGLVRQPWAQYRPSVDSDGQRFTIAYHEAWNNSTDLDARYSFFAAGDVELLPLDTGSPAGSGANEFALQIASHYAGSGLFDPVYGTCNDYDSTSAYAIQADVYQGNSTGFLTYRTTSCGNAVGLGVTGDAVPGGVLSFTSGAAGLLSGFVVGTSASLPIGACPQCVLGVSGSSVPGSSWQFSLPNDVGLIGSRIAVQAWAFAWPNPGNGSCFGQIHLSDTLDVLVR